METMYDESFGGDGGELKGDANQFKTSQGKT